MYEALICCGICFCEAITRQDYSTLLTCESDEKTNEVMQKCRVGHVERDEEELFIKA